jgi:hypothetical protein
LNLSGNFTFNYDGIILELSCSGYKTHMTYEFGIVKGFAWRYYYGIVTEAACHYHGASMEI